ncbi:hypothetical protein [Paenibacillus sp. HB172176]|uniref:hypothetical protein n=1 Tax=Paenibacillus sp. HB172176 TaxID=2493690 RepID=UPI001439E11F|nr:hypothetical protein [Paenibacillus sp. HB172176]
MHDPRLSSDANGMRNVPAACVKPMIQGDGRWRCSVEEWTDRAVEAMLAKFIRPTESVFIPIFGPRARCLADRMERCGADMMVLESSQEWPIAQEEIIDELRKRKPSMVVLTQEEPAMTPKLQIPMIGSVCQELDIILALDWSDRQPLDVLPLDDWLLDVMISELDRETGSGRGQVLMTYNDRAAARMRTRRSSQTCIEE